MVHHGMDPVPAQVHGVFMAAGIGGSAPVVIIMVVGEQYIPIFIGFFEALSIHQALHHRTTPRPLTHDLIIDLLSRFKISVRRLVIDSIEDGVFYANLILAGNGTEDRIDCRPSDGIAIAVRAEVPILIDPGLAGNTGMKKEDLPEMTDFSAFLGGFV